MKIPICTVLAFFFSAGSFAQSALNISSGTTVTLSNGANLIVNDMDFANNGTFQQGAGGGTVAFTGNGDNTLSGTGATAIDTLSLEKAVGAVVHLQSDVQIASEINFGGGLLDVGNNTVDLGSNGLLNNESDNSRAYSSGTGLIQSTQTLNAPTAVNVGNLGAVITSAANLGSTVVQRGFTSTGVPGGSILRYYVITPTNDAGLDATVRFQYLDDELNGLDENTLGFWKSTDNINWVDSGYTTRDPVANYIERTYLSDLSYWTLAPTARFPLPVTLGSFNARKNGDVINVYWQVLTETNVRNYVVERSNDDKQFTAIGTVTAAGLSNYLYPDGAPLSGTNYYRLRIVDDNGALSYSKAVAINITGSGSIRIFPNPVTGHIATLELSNVAAGDYQLSLLDNTGKRVYQSVIAYDGGASTRQIALPQQLVTGVYHIRLENGTTQFNSTLIVE